ncbi:Zn(2)-C6 fungal-type domain-containing protein [Trichoderma simmonsii]|uniref:Zn(2)-C6 fungal-type domain-containing protein n=2 Tax=Trichoderma simmonsii TaxID=1491479 RepID=A0A8G0L0Y5_9HYPO|nr:Zn(2)-C6 fungal-type domain-containing protein [Trichoderma simmonsii]
MVYNGPSKGCRRCVSIKVKCDENKPSCLRCRKAAQVCEYKDTFDLIIRNQSHHAAETAKSKWRRRATRPRHSPSPPGTNSIQLASSQQAYPNSALVPKSVSLRPSLQHMVQLRFLYDFASAQDRAPEIRGSLDQIPQMMADSSPNSWFHSALSALSLVNFGGRLKSQEAKDAAVVFYNDALGRFASVMSNSTAGKIKMEEVLFGIFLLGIYEVMTSTDFDGIYAIHLRGAISILEHFWEGGEGKKRLDKPCYAPVLHMQTLIFCLANNEPPPSFLADMKLHATSDPRSDLTTLMHRACQIRYELMQQSPLVDNEKPNEKLSQRLHSRLQEAMDLDEALEEWYQRNTSPGEWASSRICPVNVQIRPPWARELFSLLGSPTEMIIYDSFLAALSTNLYRGTRLLLNLSILECAHTSANSSRSDTDTSRIDKSIASSTAALLMEIINDLCMTVPSMLQLTATGGLDDPQSTEELYSLRGMLMLWPLSAVMACLQNKHVQRLDVDFRRGWVQGVLAFLRDSMSLAKAQAFITKYN